MPLSTKIRPLPHQFTNGITRSLVELRVYLQTPAALVFSFFSAVFYMLITGLLYGHNALPGVGPISHTIVAGSVAMGIASFGMLTTSISVAVDRQFETLKRLASTPFSGLSYIINRSAFVLFLSFLQAIVILVLGAILFQSSIPLTINQWLVFIAIFILALLCFTSFGIFFGFMARNAQQVMATLNFPFIILQFISGVFYPMKYLWEPSQVLGSIFPLKWIAQGFRYSLLPDSARVGEIGGQWDLGYAFLIVGGWTILGLILAVFAYRRRGFDKI